MKNIRQFVLLGILFSFAWSAAAGVQFKFSGVIPSETEGHVSSKTNVTGRATTIVTTSDFKSGTFTLDNAQLLKILANSFNTEFPANATLGLSSLSDKISVMDGTNILLDVSRVFTIQSSDPFILSDSVVSTEITTANQDLSRLHVSYKVGSLVTLRYDDTGLATSDGRTTVFSVTGIRTMQSAFSYEGKTRTTSVLTEFDGAGQGNFFDGSNSTAFVLTGKLSDVSNSAD